MGGGGGAVVVASIVVGTEGGAVPRGVAS